MVKTVTLDGGTPYSYSYDASENLESVPTISATSTTSSSYDYGDELCWSDAAHSTDACGSSPSGSTAYSYNDDGDRTSASGATTVSAGWNGKDQLTSYDDSAADMTAAVYDGNGVRASDTFGSTTSYFAWDDVTGSEPRLLVDGTNAYIYALGDIPLEQVALSSGTVSYLLTDRLGSVRGIVSAAGSLSASTAYTGNNPLNATDPSGELFVCGSACTGGNGLAPASGGPGDGVAYQGTLATFDHADTASYDTGDGYGASVGAQVQNWAGYEDGIIPIPILKSCSTLLCDVVGDVGMALATADGGEVGDAVVGGADVIDAISGAVDGADDAAGTAPGAEEGAGALRVSGPEGSGPSLPMNWDSINAVSEKYGLDLSENDVNINSSIAVLRGSTAEDGTITLYRGAFDNEETLAKTLVHEQFHVDQLDGGMTYPSSYDPNSSFETSAEEYAQQWWLSQQ